MRNEKLLLVFFFCISDFLSSPEIKTFFFNTLHYCFLINIENDTGNDTGNLIT